jgi:hypothetical protein
MRRNPFKVGKASKSSFDLGKVTRKIMLGRNGDPLESRAGTEIDSVRPP